MTPIPDTIPTGLATDATDQINAWLDSLPPLGAVAEFSGATYRCDGKLRLHAKQEIGVVGNGSILRPVTPGDPGQANTPHPTRWRPIWEVVSCGTVTLDWMTGVGIKPRTAGYNAAFEAQHGIDIESSRHVKITRFTVTDLYGDFVYVGHGGDDHTRSVDVLIGGTPDDACHASYLGRHGLTVAGGEQVRWLYGSAGGISYTGVDLESDGHGPADGASFVEVGHVHFGYHGHNLLSAGGSTAPVTDVWLHDCLNNGAPLSIAVPAVGGPRTRFRITNNVSDTAAGSSTQAAMLFNDVDTVEVSGNVQPFQVGRFMRQAAFPGCTNVSYDQADVLVSQRAVIPAQMALSVALADRLVTHGETTVPSARPGLLPYPATPAMAGLRAQYAIPVGTVLTSAEFA